MTKRNKRFHQEKESSRASSAAFRAIGVLTLSALLLGGCTRLADWLGFEEDRGFIDPVLIPETAPLIVPPDIFLRPPQKGAERAPSSEQAARLLLRESANASGARATSPGEKSLLAYLKTSRAVKNIRVLLEEEGGKRRIARERGSKILDAVSEALEIEKRTQKNNAP